MRETAAALFALMTFALRLLTVRRLWRLPLRHGEVWFLSQPVGPGFHQGPGAALLRRYQASLFVPLLADLPIAIALTASERYVALLFEQFTAWLLATVAYNVLVVHFSFRAATLVGDQGEPAPTAVRLSMEPRRLRDHTRPLVEVVVWGALLASMGLIVLFRGYHGFFQLAKTALLVLYFQAGLLLLKALFVRWRKPLPRQRVEEFLRWRAGWLRANLAILDDLRLVFALSFAGLIAWRTTDTPWSHPRVAIGLMAIAMAAIVIHASRERRGLAALEKELRPIELVREFPRKPVAQGRFIGGALYWNRDNPGVLVRGPDGVALNLAHSSTYVWAAYFVGLALLLSWLTGR